MLAHLRIGTREDETEGFDGVELRQEAEAADVSGDTYAEHRPRRGRMQMQMKLAFRYNNKSE